MSRLIALLFLLVPSIAMSQAVTKNDMLSEFTDIATLVGAEVLKCGETNKERVLKFNQLFDDFIMFEAEKDGIELTINEIEAWKLTTLIEQHYGIARAHEEMGCEGINKIIHVYDGRMRFADSVYDYYTPYNNL